MPGNPDPRANSGEPLRKPAGCAHASSVNFTARGYMPTKHPRSSRMAARRTNFTSKSDIASEGEFIHDEVSTISSIDDAPTHSAPSPTPTPSTPSSNSLKSAEKKSLAQIMATYGSSNPSSNPGAWGSSQRSALLSLQTERAQHRESTERALSPCAALAVRSPLHRYRAAAAPINCEEP